MGLCKGREMLGIQQHPPTTLVAKLFDLEGTVWHDAMSYHIISFRVLTAFIRHPENQILLIFLLANTLEGRVDPKLEQKSTVTEWQVKAVMWLYYIAYGATLHDLKSRWDRELRSSCQGWQDTSGAVLIEVFELLGFSSEFLAFVLGFSVTGLLIWFLFLFCGVWKKSKIYGLKIKK